MPAYLCPFPPLFPWDPTAPHAASLVVTSSLASPNSPSDL